MKHRSHPLIACVICSLMAGCNVPQGGGAEGEPVDEVTAEVEGATPTETAERGSDTPPFVQALWDRSLEIASPCENAASVLADRLSFTSPQNAKPEAQKGLETCEVALKNQNALRVPAEAEGELAVILDAAIHECREALDARRKFFETSILVLDGDTSTWRTTMVTTTTTVAQSRSAECIVKFKEAGLEI